MKRHICMIAYTDYAGDARVRREAETLASQGFNVVCLTNRNGGKPTRYALDGVEVRELRVGKYRGKSTVAYLLSYIRFLMAASTSCLGLMVKGKLDVVHVHNLPDFLVLAGLVPRLAGRKVVLDIHDSVPETFAAKFSNAPLVHKLLCLEERLSAVVAHKSHLRQPSAARDARGPRHPGRQDVRVDERARPTNFRIAFSERSCS